MQIAPDSSIIVRAPEKIPEEIIHQAIQKKLPWIIKKQKLARERFVPVVKREFASGETFLYLGELYKLQVFLDANDPLVFNGMEFKLSGRYLLNAKKIFEKWYRKQTKEIINNRAKLYAEMAGLKYARISITGAKSRWGSCSFKGNLNFSWKLIMAPQRVVDYVVIHELVHLSERNHSRRFWDKVSVFMPDYKNCRKWLKDNGGKLYL